MRVCFNGLCFATKKPADSIDDDTTTVVVTTGSPVAPVKSTVAHPDSTQLNGRDIYRSFATVDTSETQQRHPENLSPERENEIQPNTNRTVFTSRTESDKMEQPDANNPFVVVAMEDPLPGALLPPALNQIADQVDRMYIADDNAAYHQLTPPRPATPNSQPGSPGEHYKRIVLERDAQIAVLQATLQRKEDEIAELKSHLDKFQSVFPFSRGRKTGTQHGAVVQRQRAQGISAEPQNESQVMELINQTFPKYDKQDR